MKVKDLRARLKELDQNKDILMGNDEELNSVFSEVSLAKDDSGDCYFIYPDESSMVD